MRHVRVLIADHEPAFLRMVAERLRATMITQPDIGIDVVLASSYDEARDARGFEAAAIDEQLAGPSGLELIAAFRKTARHRRTPFLVMSADLVGDLTHRAHALGATPLAKRPIPSLAEGIVRAVRSVAGTARSSNEERLHVARALARESGLSKALTEVFEAVALGLSYEEIAQERGTTLGTVEKQRQAVIDALRARKIQTRESLRATLDAEVIEARYDDE